MTGRTTGCPSHGSSLQDTSASPRQVLVCFDCEGHAGMPFRASYDVESSTHRILETLDRHRVKAVFFVVGALAVEHPGLLGDISSAGHELGLHGWQHEHLAGLSWTQLARFADGLAESEAAFQSVTGARPAGFRAPFLLRPAFFDAALYELLAGRGYRWTSNREVRHVVELLRPDRIRTERPWRSTASNPQRLRGVTARALLLALNVNIYRGNAGALPSLKALRWLLDGYPPFRVHGLLEIPLYGPMDCDLLGLPRPSEPTPSPLLEFAQFAMQACLSSSGPISMLSFHDWIITGCNRLQLLDALLTHVTNGRFQAVTVEGGWTNLSNVACHRGMWAPPKRHTRNGGPLAS